MWNLRKFTAHTLQRPHDVDGQRIKYSLNVNRLWPWWLFAFIYNGNVLCLCKLFRNRDNKRDDYKPPGRLVPERLCAVHFLGVLHHNLSPWNVRKSRRLFCCCATTNHANCDKVRRTASLKRFGAIENVCEVSSCGEKSWEW